MSDQKLCDLCKTSFSIHRYSYETVSLPSFDGMGVKQDNAWKDDVVGMHNAGEYDVCTACYKKIVLYLRSLVNN